MKSGAFSYGMSASEYNVAVHGVPLSYYSGPEHESDEEWCEANGLDHNDMIRAEQRERAECEMQESDLVVLTDAKGQACESLDEPACGSVVLTEGDWGTAWQRFFSDGLWHRVGGGKPVSWVTLLSSKRNIRLAYDAPEREG